MNVPENLRYTSHDEWVLVDGDTATIGITDFAQDALGELVHVELPEVGEVFAVGAAVAEVESVKAVAEIYAPIGGEVVEVNEALDGEEEKINEDPYAVGWLFKLRIADPSELDALLDAAAYAAKIAG